MLLLQTLYKYIIALLYPSFCLLCKKLIAYDHALCDLCYAQLSLVPDLHEKLVSKKLLTVYAISSYQGFMAQLVQAKERRDIQSARQLGRIAAVYCLHRKLKYDVVIAVPLHWSRFMIRGYNQAMVMAEFLAPIIGACVMQPFTRHRATRQQRLLDGVMRKKNVSGAFALRWSWSALQTRELLAGKRVLLIDDVYTTGSTLKEFARVVACYNPARLDALVACRVVD